MNSMASQAEKELLEGLSTVGGGEKHEKTGSSGHTTSEKLKTAALKKVQKLGGAERDNKMEREKGETPKKGSLLGRKGKEKQDGLPPGVTFGDATKVIEICKLLLLCAQDQFIVVMPLFCIDVS